MARYITSIRLPEPKPRLKSPPSLRLIGDADVTVGALAALLIQLPPRRRDEEEER